MYGGKKKPQRIVFIVAYITDLLYICCLSIVQVDEKELL